MNNIKKRILSLVTAAIAFTAAIPDAGGILPALSIKASAADTCACGQNLTWSLTDSNTVLTIPEGN